ncbi:hypothetical protein Pelo_19513 [Pelomyxa schiedti]|nr:hypothetical protein Pelo_19513 [Pelomyxa schiedti]
MYSSILPCRRVSSLVAAAAIVVVVVAAVAATGSGGGCGGHGDRHASVCPPGGPAPQRGRRHRGGVVVVLVMCCNGSGARGARLPAHVAPHPLVVLLVAPTAAATAGAADAYDGPRGRGVAAPAPAHVIYLLVCGGGVCWWRLW